MILTRRDFLKNSGKLAVAVAVMNTLSPLEALASSDDSYAVIFNGVQETFLKNLGSKKNKYVSECSKLINQCIKQDIPTIFNQLSNGGNINPKILMGSIDIPRHTYTPLEKIEVSDGIYEFKIHPVADSLDAHLVDDYIKQETLAHITGSGNIISGSKPNINYWGLNAKNVIVIGHNVYEMANLIPQPTYNVTSMDMLDMDSGAISFDFVKDLLKSHKIEPYSNIEETHKNLNWGVGIVDMQPGFLIGGEVSYKQVNKAIKAQNEIIKHCKKNNIPILVFENRHEFFKGTDSRLKLKGYDNINVFQREKFGDLDPVNGFEDGKAAAYCTQLGLNALYLMGGFGWNCFKNTGDGSGLLIGSSRKTTLYEHPNSLHTVSFNNDIYSSNHKEFLDILNYRR